MTPEQCAELVAAVAAASARQIEAINQWRDERHTGVRVTRPVAGPGLGFPAIGAGVEGNIVVTQAAGVGTQGYVGLLAVARETWIRTSVVTPTTSSIWQYGVYRGVTGQALLGNAPFPLRAGKVTVGQIIGGVDKTVLGGDGPHTVLGFPVAFTGNQFWSGSDFLAPPLVLAAGDAFVVLGGTANAGATLTINWVELT